MEFSCCSPQAHGGFWPAMRIQESYRRWAADAIRRRDLQMAQGDPGRAATRYDNFSSMKISLRSAARKNAAHDVVGGAMGDTVLDSVTRISRR
jgi:hypothetical protein